VAAVVYASQVWRAKGGKKKKKKQPVPESNDSDNDNEENYEEN
jgi:hypothetical protein